MSLKSSVCCRSGRVSPQLDISMAREYVFVVNPNGANGRTGKEWAKLVPKLSARLGDNCKVQEAFTSGPLHAVEITREAIKDGASAVVAVGGDGTLHEVVNGFFEDRNPIAASKTERTALGLIPLGTGSDFARTLGWTNNPMDAVERIVRGQRKRIDVGYVHIGEQSKGRYFLNVADIHLSAKAGYHASRHKLFGNLCYVIGALQAFTSHDNKDLVVKIDGANWKPAPQVTAMAIGNAKFFGGGMKITPNAEPSSGDFEVITLQGFKWFDFLLKLHRLYKGTHTSVQNVSTERAHTIAIAEASSEGGPADSPSNFVYVQADGEHLGFLPATFSVIPAVIDLLI